jgi:hypothetical protein
MAEKISLIVHGTKAHVETTAKTAASNFNGLAAISKFRG